MELENIHGDKVRLVANGLTYLLYKTHFKKDLLKSVTEFLATQEENVQILGRFAKMTEQDMIKLENTEREELYAKFKNISVDITFLAEVATALMLSGNPNDRRDIHEIMAEIPASWFATDGDDFKRILELMVSLIPAVKKKEIAK